jgi:RNA polymerase sigma-70 factor (ECF subfamily)
VYKDLSEQDLAKLCSERDKLAEDELYRRYAARVFTLCRRYIGDDDEAKDLMQETLIRAIEKIDTFNYNGSGSLFGWIRRIAINRALNHIKRRRWRTVSLDLLPHSEIQDPAEEDMDALPPDKILEFVSRLPYLRRVVFNLFCIDGYSHKEIARMLGISEKGSSGVLAKARKQLKAEINQYLNERAK